MSAISDMGADFTEARYCYLLALAKNHYRFEPFGTACTEPHALWRHDIDYSMQRAKRIAEIDTEAGARATFFFMLGSPYYSLFEPETKALARAIAAMGHHLGLHFDPEAYRALGQAFDLEERVAFERSVLEDLLGAPIDVVSFHNPAHAGFLEMTTTHVGGLLNVYGGAIRSDYLYASDSFGYWRHTPIHQVLKDRPSQRLHILTHPVWWTPQPASPRAKIEACVQGRSRFGQETYDNLMKSVGTWETVRK